MAGLRMGYQQRYGMRITYASTPVDPLSGIDFLLRLQSHNCDYVPLGLYQDLSGTIPATQEGDVIKLWKDELSGSGLSASQSSDLPNAPSLSFVNGVPTVKLPNISGVGMTTGVALPSPWSIAFGGACSSAGNNRVVQATDQNRVVAFNRSANSVFIGGDVTGDTSTVPGSDAAVGMLTESTTAHWYVDGLDRTDNPAFSGVNFGTVAIGGAGAASEPVNGYMTSLFLADIVWSAEDQAKINEFAALLNP